MTATFTDDDGRVYASMEPCHWGMFAVPAVFTAEDVAAFQGYWEAAMLGKPFEPLPLRQVELVA